jgi:outer membrane lipoprotein SlyB
LDEISRICQNAETSIHDNNNFKIMTKIFYSRSKQHHTHLAIVGFCLLSGCSALNVSQDDKNDICYSARGELRQSEHYYAQSIIQGAAVGGVAGAGLGALTAAISGGNIGSAALIGGLSGAVVGGAGGYYLAKQKDISDEQSLAASVRGDILAENGQIDRTAVAFARLRDCRFAAAERIKAEYKASHITKDIAVKQLDDLKRQFDEDIKISQELGLKMGSRLTEFQDANNKILERDPNARALLNAEKLRKTETLAVAGTEPTKQSREVVKSSKKKAKKQLKATATATESPEKSQTLVAKQVAPATSPAIEVAHVTETNQIKQKAFVDQIDKAKSQAKVAFALEGSVSLIAPDNQLCGL